MQNGSRRRRGGSPCALSRTMRGILVELIVVLVILAILAAIMVPQLVGYIDKARNKQYMLDARNVQIAAQTILNEQYASANAGTGYKWDDDGLKDDILALAELTGVVDITALETATDSYKITSMTITDKGKTLTFNSGKWNIS